MLITDYYLTQIKKWPSTGRHILAQYDDKSIIVYQAYNNSIADFAIKNGYFGGNFKFSRMSWIKTNFLWMMYRSNWGTAINQEVILAIRLKKEFFNEILECAIPTTYDSEVFENFEEWKLKLSQSEVRIQWDPDHDPSGTPLKRKAIQLGLKGEMLKRYNNSILEIINLTNFVVSQRNNLVHNDYSKLTIPKEEIYLPNHEGIIKRHKISID